MAFAKGVVWISELNDDANKKQKGSSKGCGKGARESPFKKDSGFVKKIDDEDDSADDSEPRRTAEAWRKRPVGRYHRCREFYTTASGNKLHVSKQCEYVTGKQNIKVWEVCKKCGPIPDDD